ncbi:hypothetical protein BDR26DRAFT_894759 [Obelidium mucronatum]|nr:hypothetical protein BDR26DRAFT_894759 [Obelidium mucronatum]
MDALFNASFVDFIKNEKNCEFNGRHVAHLVKDYKLDQVVQGIKWLVDGWAIESTARLLKSVFDDWLPELAAFAIARIGCEWQLRPKMGLIVAFMMMGESPNVAALFIRSLTIGWDSAQITELISCLDTVLEWEDDYFTKFTELLLLELKEASRVGEIHDVDPNVIIKALASMYKTTAAMTNHRIVMADLRLAVAKSHYLTQFAHSITCQDCLHRKPCAFSSRALTPNPASIIAAMRNRIRPNAGGRGGFTIQPNGSVQPTVPSENSPPPPPNQSTDNSSNDFSYLLDRIPPSLREFFGAATSTTTPGGSETEFTIPESTQDFLYNFDEDEFADFDQDYDDDADDNDDLDEDHDDRYNDENDSILNNPLLTTRSNSLLSILQSHAVGPVGVAAAAGSGSVFSRGTSENSFLSARQGPTAVTAPSGLTSGGGLVLPNTVFETHQPSMDSFRSASSMMSLALSSLDLTGNSNSVGGGAFGGEADAGNFVEGNQSRVLTRNESAASFKSSENL